MSRPMTSSSSTSPSVNSRRATVCTLSTPTSPPGSVSIGTDTIEVKSRPRSDWIGRYRGSASLSWVMTTGSRWLATQPEMPDPNGSRIFPTEASNGGVAPARVSDRSVSSSTCTKHTSVPVAAVIIRAAAAASGSTPGPGRGGLDQLAQQRQFAVGVDEIAHGVGPARGVVGRGGHW